MTVLYVSDEAGNGETISQTIEPGGRYEKIESIEEGLLSVSQRKDDRLIVPIEVRDGGLNTPVLHLLSRFASAGELTVVKCGWIDNTQYWSVAAPRPPHKDARRTLILFESAEGVPNALFRALATFAGRKLEIHRVTSFSSDRDVEEWVTLLDVEGVAEKSPLQSALDDATAFSSRLIILGSYVFSPH